MAFATAIPIGPSSAWARGRAASHASSIHTTPTNPPCPRKPLTTITADLVRTHIHLPPRGISLELLSTPASASSASTTTPPLLFVHGSLHGAWCYARFLSRLAAAEPGRAASAVSLRGWTSLPPPEPGVAIPCADHVADLAALLDALPGPPRVLLAHSLGGLFAQKLVEARGPGCVAGLVLMASLPPGGRNKLVLRTFPKVGPRLSWRITLGFVRRTVTTDMSVARDMFFTRPGRDRDEAMEGDAQLAEWMGEMAKAAEHVVDMRTVTPLTDSAIASGLEGRVLVVGGKDDVIVDETALDETAAFWRCAIPPILLDGSPHDLMLATNWEAAFDAVFAWVRDDLPAAMEAAASPAHASATTVDS